MFSVVVSFVLRNFCSGSAEAAESLSVLSDLLHRSWDQITMNPDLSGLTFCCPESGAGRTALIISRLLKNAKNTFSFLTVEAKERISQ